jgi:hypothetical protein
MPYTVPPTLPTRLVCRREVPTRRAAVLHRSRRASLPVLHHRPTARRPGRLRRPTASTPRSGRVKTLKATGASHLPFHAFAPNAAWLELALTRARPDGLDADAHARRRAPPLRAKRLRCRILHVAGLITATPARPPSPARRLALGRAILDAFQTPRGVTRRRLTRADRSPPADQHLSGEPRTERCSDPSRGGPPTLARGLHRSRHTHNRVHTPQSHKTTTIATPPQL